jgi:ketosteroid isomerase-like protein
MIQYLLPLFIIISFLSCNSASQENTKETDYSKNHKAVIDQYFQHFNKHDWQKMAEMYIDQPEMKDPAYGIKNVKMTKAEIIKKYSELHQMIPDVKDSVINMYHSGNQVIVEFESSGTGPDGKKFVLPICTIFELKDGKIARDLTYYDNMQ